jgi:type I restriction enzyme S subunit
VQPIGDVFEFLGGGTPSKTEPAYWDEGDVEWFTPSDLTGAKRTFMDRSSTRITEEGLRRSSAQLFPPFSVMMTSRATVGVIAINTAPATTNQGFITCLPNERVPLAFLLYWLRQNVPVFIAHATGATFKEITKGVFRRLPMAMPPADLVHRFEALCRPMLDQVLVHERSQERLAAARDLLLPRLISGELTVADAERTLETAA